MRIWLQRHLTPDGLRFLPENRKNKASHQYTFGRGGLETDDENTICQQDEYGFYVLYI